MNAVKVAEGGIPPYDIFMLIMKALLAIGSSFVAIGYSNSPDHTFSMVFMWILITICWTLNFIISLKEFIDTYYK